MGRQQKAVLLDGVGGKFALGTTELKSSALNPVDWKIQKYGFGITNFPLIVGFDAAGDVEEVGEGVQGFSKGDKVFFEDGFQQYAISPANRTAKIPSGWSYDQTATIPTGLFTAWGGLYHKDPHGFALTGPEKPSAAGKYANTPIVILGGASSVGQFTIQLAKYSGFSPIITTASLKHESFLKGLGATHLIDRFIPLSKLHSEVAAITSEPIKLVYDAISIQETQQAGYDLLAGGGKIALVLPSQISVAEGSGKSIIAVSAVVTAPQNVEYIKEVYGIITSFLETGAIVPNKVQLLSGGLAGILEGLKLLENDQVSGVKLVVHPDELLELGLQQATLLV
ncbi:chaperonin 10-like protein [Cyathus striatus]|nr:chaperonin 10-like protein [Cyathus striatus]